MKLKCNYVIVIFTFLFPLVILMYSPEPPLVALKFIASISLNVYWYINIDIHILLRIYIYIIPYSLIIYTYIYVCILPSPKRCLFTTDRDHYRKSQWIKIQRMRNYMVPAWSDLSRTPASKTQRPWRKRGWEISLWGFCLVGFGFLAHNGTMI